METGEGGGGQPHDNLIFCKFKKKTVLQETFSGSQPPPPSPDATCLSANSVVVLMLL